MAYTWPGVRVLHLPKTDRCKLLAARWAFFAGEQHDHKAYDFAGRRRKGRNLYVLERLQDLGFDPVHPPAMAEREPDCPIPLARQIIKGFTQMVFPRCLAPTLEVPADPRTERYQQEVFARSHTWVSLMAARTIAGAVGEAAVRVFVVGHLPSSEPLDTRELHVRRWADRVRHVPADVVWQRLVEVEEETAKGLETRKVWRTRVFDETHEYVYQDVAEDYGAKAIEGLTRDDGETADTGWIPIAVDDAGMPEVIEHQAGRCPVVWITSTRTTTGPTGEPDCHGTEKLLDKADYTASMATRSANANADPTLKLKDTRQWHMANRTVEKGHGRMIRVSEQGDAELLEASGAAVEMAWKTYEHQRDAVLQTTGAVIIDPKVAGAWAQSGRALSILWRPMEAAAGEKRVPMEGAIEQLADMWRAIGKVLGVCSTEDEEPDGLVLPPVKLDKALAAKQGYEVVEQVVDDDASDVLCVHQVGVGRHVTIVWPPYHEASTEQFAAVAQAATVATGGQAVIAQRSGVRMALRAAGLPDDVEKEIKAIEEEAEGRMERAAAFVDGDEEGSPPPEQDDQDDEPEDDDDDSGDEDEDGDEDA